MSDFEATSGTMIHRVRPASLAVAVLWEEEEEGRVVTNPVIARSLHHRKMEELEEENERLRAVLSSLQSAASNVLTGVSIYNSAPPDSMIRGKPIYGPVIDTLKGAEYEARSLLRERKRRRTQVELLAASRGQRSPWNRKS